MTLCHKTNVLTWAGDLWQRTAAEVATDYPSVEVDYVHVDAACLYLVTEPERFDVMVTDNLFGDIITDLGAAIQGGMGVAASATSTPSDAARPCSNRSMARPRHRRQRAGPTRRRLCSRRRCVSITSARPGLPAPSSQRLPRSSPPSMPWEARNGGQHRRDRGPDRYGNRNGFLARQQTVHQA